MGFVLAMMTLDEWDWDTGGIGVSTAVGTGAVTGVVGMVVVGRGVGVVVGGDAGAGELLERGCDGDVWRVGAG